MNLADMKIAVTGGGSGLGRQFCLSLAEAGASVAFCDVSDEGIAETESATSELPGKVVGFRANVGEEADVIAFMDGAWEALGSLDGLINNAGIFRDGLLVKKDRKTGEIRKMSIEQWDSVIQVNLTGPFLCTREFVERAIRAELAQSVVVNISSASRHGNRGQTNYSAAKAGIVAATKLWAEELAAYGVRTGAVAPGFIDTPILQGMRPDVLEATLKGVPLHRAGAPTEIFQAVKFIFECDYFTGRCIDVDGGLRL